MKEEYGGIILSILYSIFAFTLFVAFMVLKLCGVIGWSWWVVSLPLWALPAAFTAFVALLLVVFGVLLVFDKIKRKKRIMAIQRGRKNG